MNTCDLCSKSFVSKSNVNRHKKHVHEGVKYECKYCTKTYTSDSGFRSHVQNIHKRYHCPFCFLKFVSHDELIYHQYASNHMSYPIHHYNLYKLRYSTLFEKLWRHTLGYK